MGVVVLAAGQGTRMRSSRPKVLHAVAGKAMLRHVLDAVESLRPARCVVVVGPDQTAVAQAAAPHATAWQTERLGTGHAVQAARAALGELAADPHAEVLVTCGDTPLLTAETLAGLRRARAAQDADLAVLGFQAADPGSYGRLVLDDQGLLQRIVEAKDARADELAIDRCNAGVLLARADLLFQALARVTNDNAKGEYYLTDVVAIARGEGARIAVELGPEAEMQGVNSRADLAAAEARMQARLRAHALDQGVTLTAPETVFLSHDTALAPDVTVEPHVVFGPGVSVAEGATIKAFSHLEGARVGAGAQVGPYARLRPGTVLGEGSRIGNFVETKNAELGAGAKANHLTYLGDTVVGAAANIGAGTITCNYDGYLKHRTEIGAGAFIGSNSALVAPVKVGAGAILGAGTTLTQDVADDALAVTRADQRTVAGGAARFRESRQAEQARRTGAES
ncbi:MAG: bifunctional UDP-N-acetylglucosamine diphosphorylase/glucosamine-1-phosphate N-acetyltransferase GlmU [Rhodovibrio sp.]|nr:bifunctional UDP-N-acetylglucosamine diphosphorylase/glucosamine-1-phosphate N-acetyltransferase GlmU [Rhodovibrio sp.]